MSDTKEPQDNKVFWDQKVCVYCFRIFYGHKFTTEDGSAISCGCKDDDKTLTQEVRAMHRQAKALEDIVYYLKKLTTTRDPIPPVSP